MKIKDQQRKKTVRREIKILQMVNHPNIVKIMDVVETNNHVNIMMEYLPGISLGSSIKQQPNHRFPEEYCKKVLKELAEAMKYLHNRNIAHRDIKLENIILDDKNSPKLIDFGFSTCIERGKKVILASYRSRSSVELPATWLQKSCRRRSIEVKMQTFGHLEYCCS